MEVAARGGDRGVAERLLEEVDGRAPVEAVAGVGMADGGCTLKDRTAERACVASSAHPGTVLLAALTGHPFSSTSLTAKVYQWSTIAPWRSPAPGGFYVLSLCAFAAGLWRTCYS